MKDFTGTLPFPTIRELTVEEIAEYRPQSLTEKMNSFAENSSYFVPCCIEYNEYAQITLTDGCIFSAVLDVDYYEGKTPAVADILSKDLLRFYLCKEELSACDFAAVDAEYDSLYAYKDAFGSSGIVVKKGCVVLHSRFLQTSESYQIPFEEWTSHLINSLSD